MKNKKPSKKSPDVLTPDDRCLSSIRKILGDDITREHKLAEESVDDLDFIDIVTDVEAEFNIEIKDDGHGVDDFKTFGDLIKWLVPKGNN